MNENKDYWLDRHRFLAIAIILMLMWGGFMVFYYLKADEITRDPCSICAERMGKDVLCTTGKYVPVTKVYFPNGSEYVNSEDVKVAGLPEYDILDFGKLNG